MTCEICGSGQSATHHTREMMLGLGDRFDYSECLGCGRLRLLNPPSDLSRYYPADYYSFAPRGALGTLKTVLFRVAAVRALLATIYPVFVLDLIRMLALKPSMKILDVGGGNGALEPKSFSIPDSSTRCASTALLLKKPTTAGM